MGFESNRLIASIRQSAVSTPGDIADRTRRIVVLVRHVTLITASLRVL